MENINKLIFLIFFFFLKKRKIKIYNKKLFNKKKIISFLLYLIDFFYNFYLTLIPFFN